MNLSSRYFFRWIVVIISFIIISLILFNTYIFFQHFKAEERTKMEIWSLAQEENIKTLDLNGSVNSLAFDIVKSNVTTPMVVIDKRGDMGFKNIDSVKAQSSKYLKTLMAKYAKENDSIPVKYKGETLQTIYYGNSPLINKLKYYPLGLLLIIVLFATVAYLFYKSSRTAIENKLWSGMAKETAHQIGTPLSSLVGWTELLKKEQVNPEYITEIEKDITRLQTITDRFSKIGSLPNLEKRDVVKETLQSYNYLQSRSSKLINFKSDLPKAPIYVNLNAQLYSWVIENLVRNGIDAMKGKGTIIIAIRQDKNLVNINISDTGKGLLKNKFKTIFEPGYTTKKRGWGLGLSLAKRIIREFHQGEIKVLKSAIDEGTTFQILLKTIG